MKFLGNKQEQRRRWAVGLLGCTALLITVGAVMPGGYAGLADRAGSWSDRLSGARLTLAASAERGAFAEWGQLLSDAMPQAGPYALDPIPSETTAVSLTLLEEGRANFAFASAVHQEGIAETLGVARLAPQYVHVIVPSGDEAQSFRDLSGLRLGVGPASGDAAVLAEKMLAFLSLTQPPQLVSDHSPDLEEAFLQGEIDGALVLAAPFDNAVEALFATGWYRLVPLGDASTLALHFSGLRAEVLPAGLYGKSRDVPPGGTLLTTLAVDTYLVTAPDTPARYVASILKAVHEPSLRAAARLDRLTEEDSRRVSMTALHPAAMAYYERDAPVSGGDINRFLSALLLLALVALASAAVWGLERARGDRRKAKAFLPYFEQLGKLGEAIEVSDDIGELSQQLLDLSVMQRQAEYEWRHGRLAYRDLDRLLGLLVTRSQMAYSKIQILLMAGEGATASVATTQSTRYGAPPSGNVWLPGGDTPHARGEAERTEAPQSEIRTPNTLFIKNAEGVSELAAERSRTPEPPANTARPATDPPDNIRKLPVRNPQREASDAAPPVSPARTAPEAATPEWVASFEELGPELDSDDHETGEDRAHGSRPMDPRQASANLYPTSVKLTAAMERQQADGESGFRWLNTGVGESLSVPRPRRSQQEDTAPTSPANSESEARADEASAQVAETGEDEFDVELEGEELSEPIVRSNTPLSRGEAPEENLSSPQGEKQAADADPGDAGATTTESSRTARSSGGGTRAPKERGNRRRKKKARKKEQPDNGEAQSDGEVSSTPPEAKPKDDDDQMSFF